tara:strand:- start:389 stop:742 length:354 start_codon:yes stop_codon:yes gene_type:complete
MVDKDLDRTIEVVAEVEVEVEEEDSVVVDHTMEVVAKEEVSNKTTEDKWVEVDINKTFKVVAEAPMHNLKQKCAEVFKMAHPAIMAINASMRIARMSSAFLNNNSNELSNHNSNKNK